MELFSAIYSRNTAQIARLLDAGADVNFVNPMVGLTVLNYYIRNGATAEQVQQFLDRGADPNKKNTHGGQTPLLTAIELKNLPIINVLLNGGANPNDNDARGFSPLDKAVGNSNLEIVRRLLTAGAVVQPHTLANSLRFGTGDGLKIIKLLLNAGGNPNETIRMPNGEVHLITHAVLTKKPKVVKALLDAGADGNVVDTYRGQPIFPLLEAVQDENEEIVRILADAGVYAEPHGFEGVLRASVRYPEETAIMRILAEARRRHALAAFGRPAPTSRRQRRRRTRRTQRR